MGDFVIWKYRSQPDAAILKTLEGLERKFRLRNGTPLAESFPTNVAYHMHPDFPKDLALVDNMLNIDMIAVVSSRLAETIRALSPPFVEYLPISIVDHRGNVAAADYFIVHPTEPVDCVDTAQSVFEEDLILPGDYESFSKLVIDESRVPDDRLLFRVKGFRDVTIVRRTLAQELNEGKFTGLDWLPLDQYPER